jgi:hypothetical protein
MRPAHGAGCGCGGASGHRSNPPASNLFMAAVLLRGHSGDVCGVDFNGATAATASADGVVRLFAADGAFLRDLRGHTGRVWGVSFSRDGKRLLSASGDRTAKVWDVASGLCVHTLSGHSGDVNQAKFSPDGALVATASDDGSVRLWTSAGALVRVLSHSGSVSVYAVSWSPCGRFVATGLYSDEDDEEEDDDDEDGAHLKIWDAASGAVVQSLKGHTSSVYDVAYSGGGALIASASAESVRIWKGGSCVATLLHRALVGGVAWEGEGRLWSVAEDGSARGFRNEGGVWSCVTTLPYATPHEWWCRRARWVGGILATSTGPDGVLLAATIGPPTADEVMGRTLSFLSI